MSTDNERRWRRFELYECLLVLVCLTLYTALLLTSLTSPLLPSSLLRVTDVVGLPAVKRCKRGDNATAQPADDVIICLHPRLLNDRIRIDLLHAPYSTVRTTRLSAQHESAAQNKMRTIRYHSGIIMAAFL